MRSSPPRPALIAAFVLALASGAIRAADTAGLTARPKGGMCDTPLPYALRVDVNPSGGSSNLNGVFEPGETVDVEPAWLAPCTVHVRSVASQFAGPPTATYTIVDGSATYQLPPGANYCFDCFVMSLDDPAVRPATHWDAIFVEQPDITFGTAWTLHVGRSFSDVPVSHLFYAHVEALLHARLTAGCGGGYCPDLPVTRAQLAVMLLKAKGVVTPPPATGNVFNDVSVGSFAADWIEEFYHQGITTGCQTAPPLYCPSAPVTRSQAAVLLLKATNGPAFVPPLCVGLFGDVPCEPSPSYPVDWIEAFKNAGISGGCGGGNYCPNGPTTRGQIAAFITKAFSLTFRGF